MNLDTVPRPLFKESFATTTFHIGFVVFPEITQLLAPRDDTVKEQYRAAISAMR